MMLAPSEHGMLKRPWTCFRCNILLNCFLCFFVSSFLRALRLAFRKQPMHAIDQFLADEEHRQAMRGALAAPYEVPGVRCAKIKVTARCNLRCSFCQYWRMREPDELSTDEYCRVLEELAGLGCVKVHFSGGE